MPRILLVLLTFLPFPSWSVSLTEPQQKSWLALLHFDKSGRSAINSAAFFLSPTGAGDAHAELLATINAMSLPVSKPQSHAQCRYPGRYFWLVQQKLVPETPVVACPARDNFVADQQLRSVSLIFATGFLGNPASYYGHLLLRFNSKNHSSNTGLQENALNFGADVPVNESMLLYIGKGLIGGYQSSFTQQPFFYHAYNYGESELRDMWEYELDLPAGDLQLLIRHSWEVMNADFTYYFFNRNCAYRMAELLQLVLPAQLTRPDRWWETPQAIIQRVANAADQKYIKSVKFIPSRQSRLYQRYAQLDHNSAAHVHQLIAQPDLLTTEYLNTLTPDSRYAVLDTMLDYYQVVREPKEGVSDLNNNLYNRTLSQRYLLPPSASQSSFASDNEPGLGRAPSYFSLGFSHATNHTETLRLRLRPAYYDTLDASYGHVAHSALAMGDIEISATEDRLAIHRLSLVNIESIRTNLTGLPGDNHHSWYLDVGAAQLSAGCNQCLASKVAAGIGYAKSPGTPNWVIAIFAGAGFHDSRLLSRGIYLSGKLQSSWYVSDAFQLGLSAEQRWYQNQSHTTSYQLRSRWALTTDTDLRLEYSLLRRHELVLSAGWYY